MPLATLEFEPDPKKLHATNVSFGWRKELIWEPVRLSGMRLYVATYKFIAEREYCGGCKRSSHSYFILMSTGVFYGCSWCGFVQGPMPLHPIESMQDYKPYVELLVPIHEIDPFEAIEVMRRNKQDPRHGGIDVYYRKRNIQLPKWPLY